METLDPKAKEFSQERKALLAQRQQMEEQLDGLRGSQRVGGGGADTYGAPDVLSPEVARVPTTGRTSIATDLSDVFLVTFYSWWLFSFVQTVRGKRQPRVPRPLRRSASSPSRRRLGAVPGGVPALGAGPHRGGPRLRPPRRGAGPTPEAVPTPDTWVGFNDDRLFTQKFAQFFLLQIRRIGLLYRRSLLSF